MHQSIEFFQIILEITHDRPTAEQLNRWMGEPIEMIIVPHSLFSWTRSASFHLSPGYLDVSQRFMRHLNVHVAIKCPVGDCDIADYASYFRNLANRVYTFQLNKTMTR